MTITIARHARIRFADETAPLAQVVARFAEIVAGIKDDFPAVVVDDDLTEYEFDCQMCGDGVDEVFCRLTEDGDKVEACERCVNKYRLGYVENYNI